MTKYFRKIHQGTNYSAGQDQSKGMGLQDRGKDMTKL